MKIKMDVQDIVIWHYYLRGKLHKVIEGMYYTFYIKKKHKTRKIDSPNHKLKNIQRWIYTNILEKTALPNCVHGFRKGRGIKTNALPHLGKKYIYVMDIKDFFPNIKRERVENLFHSLNFYEPVPGKVAEPFLPFEEFNTIISGKHAEVLSIICTKNNALPQGAVTSPAISNIIFSIIDKEILEICGASDVIYTRYADDLTLSGDCKKILLDTVWKVKEAIKRRGFRINRRKSRMMSGGQAKIVTGLRLNSNQLSIGNKRKKTLRARIFNWIINGYTHEYPIILGDLAYLKSIEPETHLKFLDYIKRLQANKSTYRRESPEETRMKDRTFDVKYIKKSLKESEKKFREEDTSRMSFDYAERKAATAIFYNHPAEECWNIAMKYYAAKHYELKKIAVYILGFISDTHREALLFLKNRVSSNLLMRGALARALNYYCREDGYEKIAPIILEWLESGNKYKQSAAYLVFLDDYPYFTQKEKIPRSGEYRRIMLRIIELLSDFTCSRDERTKELAERALQGLVEHYGATDERLNGINDTQEIRVLGKTFYF